MHKTLNNSFGLKRRNRTLHQAKTGKHEGMKIAVTFCCAINYWILEDNIKEIPFFLLSNVQNLLIRKKKLPEKYRSGFK